MSDIDLFEVWKQINIFFGGLTNSVILLIENNCPYNVTPYSLWWKKHYQNFRAIFNLQTLSRSWSKYGHLAILHIFNWKHELVQKVVTDWILKRIECFDKKSLESEEEGKCEWQLWLTDSWRQTVQTVNCLDGPATSTDTVQYSK